jgi:two-component system chemotaxis sensor kinase CheA
MQNESFLSTFIEECGDHLASVENDLVNMEEMGASVDKELVNRVFRAAHSIKGGAGFFELTTIKELAHKLENVLDMVRSGTLVPNPEVVNQLLNGFDRLRELLDDVENSNSADISDAVVALTGLAASYLPPSRKNDAVEIRSFPIPGSSCSLEAGALQIESVRESGNGVALLRFDLVHDVQRIGRTPMDVLKSLETNGMVLDCVVDIFAAGDLDSDTISDTLPFYVLYATALSLVEISKLVEIPASGITLMELPRKPAAKPIHTPAVQAAAAEKPAVHTPAAEEQPQIAKAQPPAVSDEDGDRHEARRSEGEGTVRIPVSVLDNLMNIAGELVLARNELLEAIGTGEKRTIANSGRRIDIVTREMQEAVMLTRMQPVGNLFNRYPRIVRDIARDFGKKIDLSISGREVEMDKTILEMLSDPLTHLLRNACDHGIEAPDVRAAAGKPETGTVTLKARHEAGNVVVEIRDDGKGIDVDAVAAKALSQGLVTEERLKFMTDKEKSALILLPGLSTAKKITDVSGRGVGMDVVKTNIDKLGGQIEIITEKGRGSSFRVKLPLTLAIIPSLLVSVGDERYAIPETNVEELLQIRVEDSKNRIERVGDRSLLVLRGNFIPIVRLADVLGIPRKFAEPGTEEKKPDRRSNIADRRTDAELEREKYPTRGGEDRRYHAASNFSVVLVSSAALKYALIVEELHDTMEIVVKPLGSHYSALREYSGATILGNGSTALILDTTGLALRAGLTSADGGDRSAAASETEGGDETAAKAESLGFLLFGNGPKEPCAMRLESVERVLRITRPDIDTIGAVRVYTHEGKAVPVFALKDVLPVSDIMADGGDIALILARAAGRRIGILATPPVDSLSTEAEIDQASFSGRGIVGSAIIKGHSTLVLDIEDFAQVVKPEWFTAAKPAAAPRTPTPTAAAGPGPALSEASPEAESPPAEGPLVLLAEDSTFFRAKVQEILSESGYRVLEARDGQEALDLFTKEEAAIDAVVTDIEMPGLDGYELTKKLREKGTHIPIIALTSLASDEDRQSGIDAGIDEFQVKLDRDELLSALDRFLNE